MKKRKTLKQLQRSWQEAEKQRLKLIKGRYKKRGEK